MNELKLIVELSPADRERVDRALGLLEKLTARDVVTIGPGGVTVAPEKPEPKKAPKTTAKKPTKAEAEAAVAQAAAKVVTETPKPAEAPADLPADNSETLPWGDPAPAEAKTEAPKPVELAELQKAITTFCVANPGKKAAVRDLVKQYGANVSGIPSDKRAEVLEKLKGL